MMVRLLKILSLPVLGLALIVAGFFYDVMFAGIPYQDPTPELQAEWEYQRSVARRIYCIGGWVFLLGILVAPFIWWWLGRSRRTTK